MAGAYEHEVFMALGGADRHGLTARVRGRATPAFEMEPKRLYIESGVGSRGDTGNVVVVIPKGVGVDATLDGDAVTIDAVSASRPSEGVVRTYVLRHAPADSPGASSAKLILRKRNSKFSYVVPIQVRTLGRVRLGRNLLDWGFVAPGAQATLSVGYVASGEWILESARFDPSDGQVRIVSAVANSGKVELALQVGARVRPGILRPKLELAFRGPGGDSERHVFPCYVFVSRYQARTAVEQPADR